MTEEDALRESRLLISKMHLNGDFSTACSNRELTPLASKIIDNKFQHMKMTAEELPRSLEELQDFVTKMVKKIGNATGVKSFTERELEDFLDNFIRSLELPDEDDDDNEEDEE